MSVEVASSRVRELKLLSVFFNFSSIGRILTGAWIETWTNGFVFPRPVVASSRVRELKRAKQQA